MSRDWPHTQAVMSASPSRLYAEWSNLPNVRQHDGIRGLHQISSAAGPPGLTKSSRALAYPSRP
jgi:hypothetical protein